jgi:hypothetical protein
MGWEILCLKGMHATHGLFSRGLCVFNVREYCASVHV